MDCCLSVSSLVRLCNRFKAVLQIYHGPLCELTSDLSIITPHDSQNWRYTTAAVHEQDEHRVSMCQFMIKHFF